MSSDLVGKTALVTGASRGLGRAIAEKLAGESDAKQLLVELEAELARRTGSSGLDILVNNIGGGGYARIGEVSEEFYDHLMTNNVRGAFFLTKVLSPHIRDFGRVINISSAGARLSDPGIIVYTMAKAAVDAFTRVLAVELGPRGITVNAVGPGFTATESNEDVLNNPSAVTQVIDATALRRFGTPEEIADAVYAFAAPLGRWITAQIVEASGGFKL